MINNIIKNGSATISKLGFTLQKHSPEILVGAGIVGMIGTTILACKATTKLNDILEDTKTNVDKIHEVIDSGMFEEEVYSKKDSQKDLVIVYRNAAIKVAKLYGPSVILGAASVAGILGGHHILKTRNVALAAAYATVDKGFREYRKRVIDRFGEDVDRQLKQDAKVKKIAEVNEETGKKEKKTVEIVNGNPNNGLSEYSRIFDDGNELWKNDAQYNRTFLQSQQHYANDLLISRGHLFLNEVYDMLGFPRTKAGQVVGWVYKPGDAPIEGDGYVDFGLFDVNREEVVDFINGRESAIWLDFNVDGYIFENFSE